ncbi:nucleotide-binding protein [Streptomyces sp. NPDC001415]
MGVDAPTPDPRQATAATLDAVAAARAAAQHGHAAPDAAPDAAPAARYGSGAPDGRSAGLPVPTPQPAPPADSRPATLPELRVPGGRDAAVPMATPESVPTVDPRLAVALGKPVHGDSVAKRAGRSVRKLGSSAAQDVAEESRIGRELQQPVTTGRVIAVTSIRGGVGKTTVAALLARSFNHYRHDPVLALEADGALGTLPVRLGAESVRWSCVDLADILTPAMQLTDVTGYLVPVTDGGWLLPASQGRLGAPLSMRTYRTVTLALRRYFAVTVVDCETLPGEVARTAMDTAHARIVVAPMTAEGVGGTRLVLDWLAHLPHSALATTVVALTANSPDTTLDLKAATAHLREAGVTVLPVPYDRHLAQGGPIQTALLGRATRQAAVALAAEAMERAVRVR